MAEASESQTDASAITVLHPGQISDHLKEHGISSRAPYSPPTAARF
jgi:hypothetical protein